MRRSPLLAAAAFLIVRAGAASVPHLSMADVEIQALRTSSRLQASEHEALAAREQTDAQWALLLPRLSLDASVRYVTTVPEITNIGPRPIPFGDNESYSVGPVLSYTLWDQGATRHLYRSFEALGESREQERKATERQVLASARNAYVRLQLAEQEYLLVQESLALARSQNRDITQRLKAGAASRLDWLNSEREVSNFELRLAQGQADLKDAARDLGALIGGIPDAVELDSLEASAKSVDPSAVAAPDAAIPQLQAQESLARSAELAARSQSATRWPLLQVQAKTSWDYPNGPNLERIHQNTLSASLTFPLLEWGRASSLASQKRAEAQAIRDRRAQAETDVQRDWQKASFRLGSLKDQRTSARKAATQSEELARLMYQAYRAGRASFLDVQGSNLRLLESRVQEARIDAQLLIQFNLLRSISGEASGKDKS